jgi:hypothetical protein
MKIATREFAMVGIICEASVIRIVTFLITVCNEKEVVRCAMPDGHFGRQIHLRIEVKL